MVAVDDLDPPGEAKIKSESTGVPPSAPPKDAFAERGESMPRDHTWSRASIVGGSGALRHRPEGGSLPHGVSEFSSPCTSSPGWL